MSNFQQEQEKTLAPREISNTTETPQMQFYAESQGPQDAKGKMKTSELLSEKPKKEVQQLKPAPVERVPSYDSVRKSMNPLRMSDIEDDNFHIPVRATQYNPPVFENLPPSQEMPSAQSQHQQNYTAPGQDLHPSLDAHPRHHNHPHHQYNHQKPKASSHESAAVPTLNTQPLNETKKVHEVFVDLKSLLDAI